MSQSVNQSFAAAARPVVDKTAEPAASPGSSAAPGLKSAPTAKPAGVGFLLFLLLARFGGLVLRFTLLHTSIDQLILLLTEWLID